MNEDILRRLQRLEDIEAIRRLKHAYCYACDDTYNTSKLRKLFSPDAVWEAEGFGTYAGPDEICTFFDGVSSRIVAAAHLVMNDMIELSDDGETATGIWRNCQPVTTVSDGVNQAMWMLARYDETYVKIDGTWYIKKLHASIQHVAPYESDWADL